ncbi:hypothetical protein H310_01615 [Aphanomyces invadans]|uniref:PH domain-containing protein n=1 Tax=Aphanomyces invadans TaxID=157072 RepID=A0A024US76_9STRA|nr:hypothetical protein H310_01615 [Aphanomyces invadans]ETW09189.1 hypothetical protein H310_01615 [Aphanomyces invadans]|eukprot:XP_008862994.1 hypothetical protein H310_01615 [Aphanomyces invadans]
MLKCAGMRSPRLSGLGNQDLFQVPPGPKEQVWEREFSIVFDGRKPTGLGFTPVKDATGYTCGIGNVVPSKERDNLAADHNEHCYLSCDLSRVITPGLRIRAINDVDSKNKAFDVVVAKIKTMQRPILLTFADVTSANFADPVTPAPDSSQHAALGEEVIMLRAQLHDAILARDEALAEAAKFQEWNQALLTTNGAMSDQNSAAADEVRCERSAAEAKQALAVQLQGDRDRALATVHLLKLENKSLHDRVDQLHQRLEDTLAAKRETSERLEALERQRNDELRLFASLQREIHVEEDETNELDKLMQASTPGGIEKDTHEATMNKLREQRAAHATQKASLEAALNEHMARAAADRERIDKLEQDKEALERSILEPVHPRYDPTQSTLVASHTSHDASSTATPAATVQLLHAELGCAHEKVVHAKAETRSEHAKWTAEKVLLLARIQAAEHHSTSLEAELKAATAATAAAAAANVASQEHEATIVRDFIHRMSTKGFRMHKHGRRGFTHDRYLYTDADGHWLSWTKVTAARHPEAFRHPSKKIVVDVKDIVEVLPGKQTQVFARLNSVQTPPDRCFSLVCAKPCRTIDIETDTPEQTQRLMQGFRLLIRRRAALAATPVAPLH